MRTPDSSESKLQGTSDSELDKILKDFKGDIISAHNNNYGEHVRLTEDWAEKQAKAALQALIAERERLAYKNGFNNGVLSTRDQAQASALAQLQQKGEK